MPETETKMQRLARALPSALPGIATAEELLVTSIPFHPGVAEVVGFTPDELSRITDGRLETEMFDTILSYLQGFNAYIEAGRGNTPIPFISVGQRLVSFTPDINSTEKVLSAGETILQATNELSDKHRRHLSLRTGAYLRGFGMSAVQTETGLTDGLTALHIATEGGILQVPNIRELVTSLVEKGTTRNTVADIMNTLVGKSKRGERVCSPLQTKENFIVF